MSSSRWDGRLLLCDCTTTACKPRAATQLQQAQAQPHQQPDAWFCGGPLLRSGKLSHLQQLSRRLAWLRVEKRAGALPQLTDATVSALAQIIDEELFQNTFHAAMAQPRHVCGQHSTDGIQYKVVDFIPASSRWVDASQPGASINSDVSEQVSISVQGRQVGTGQGVAHVPTAHAGTATHGIAGYIPALHTIFISRMELQDMIAPPSAQAKAAAAHDVTRRTPPCTQPHLPDQQGHTRQQHPHLVDTAAPDSSLRPGDAATQPQFNFQLLAFGGAKQRRKQRRESKVQRWRQCLAGGRPPTGPTSLQHPCTHLRLADHIRAQLAGHAVSQARVWAGRCTAVRRVIPALRSSVNNAGGDAWHNCSQGLPSGVAAYVRQALNGTHSWLPSPPVQLQQRPSVMQPGQVDGVLVVSPLQLVLHVLAHEMIHAVVEHMCPEASRWPVNWNSRSPGHGALYRRLSQTLVGHACHRWGVRAPLPVL